MGVEDIWQQLSILVYQVWVWLENEASVHPFLIVGAIVAIVFIVTLYNIEVREK